MVSGEVKSPRRVMPRAFKTTVYRIFGFYLTGALCVGIVAASDDPNLLGAIADGAAGAAKSPYVICEFYSSHQRARHSVDAYPNQTSPASWLSQIAMLAWSDSTRTKLVFLPTFR